MGKALTLREKLERLSIPRGWGLKLARDVAKTCPFCQRQPVIQYWHAGGPNKVLVGCENDNCAAEPSVTGESTFEGVKKWNKRT